MTKSASLSSDRSSDPRRRQTRHAIMTAGSGTDVVARLRTGPTAVVLSEMGSSARLDLTAGEGTDGSGVAGLTGEPRFDGGADALNRFMLIVGRRQNVYRATGAGTGAAFGSGAGSS